MGEGVRTYEDLVATGSLQGLWWGKVQPQPLPSFLPQFPCRERGDAESSPLPKSTLRLLDNKPPQHCLISGCLPWGQRLPCFPLTRPTAD